MAKAAALLRKEFPSIHFSSVYRSAAMNVKEQDDFLNAAAIFETDLSPEDTLKTLQAMEKKLKKNPPFRYGPRTIDLDILLYGTEILLDDALTVPHLDLHLRRFVLEPLVELGLGDMPHPGFDRLLRDFLNDAKDQVCERTNITL